MRASWTPLARISWVLFGLAGSPLWGQHEFAECVDLRDRHPGQEDGPKCVFEAAEQTASLEEAAALLGRWIAANPEQPWFRLYRGLVLWRFAGDRVADDLLAAAEKFAEGGDASAEIRARCNAASWFASNASFSKSEEQLDRVGELLERSADPWDPVRYGLSKAQYVAAVGGNLEEVHSLLEQTVERVLESREGADYRLRRKYLWTLGQVTWNLGLHRDARSYFRKRLALAEEAENPIDRVAALYDLALASMTRTFPDKQSREEALRRLYETHDLAVELPAIEIQAQASRLIAELEGGSDAEDRLEECQALVSGSGTRGWELLSGAAFDPLPWAEWEGERVVEHAGGRLAAGTEATASFLRETDLAPYGILHFAAHTIVDDRHPWRSGILFAAAGSGRYELLRPAELVQLQLENMVIVLSTCNSGIGQILRGEGAMSLARTFFEGGARAVVATLRRLPDREGAEFFDALYCELGRGKSLRQALAATQRRWIDRGRTRVWPHVVVLGDADLVVLPGSSSFLELPCELLPYRSRLAIFGAALALLALSWFFAGPRRRVSDKLPACCRR